MHLSEHAGLRFTGLGGTAKKGFVSERCTDQIEAIWILHSLDNARQFPKGRGYTERVATEAETVADVVRGTVDV